MTISTNSITDTNVINRLDSILKDNGIEADKSDVKVKDTNLTLSYVDANGVKKTLAVSIPDVDDAGHVATSDELATITDALDDALDSLAKGVAEMDGNAPVGSPQKLLFDIYALMKLMVEISQEQRNVARDERYADMNRTVASIKDQAAIQRQAAKTGMIITGISTAVSAACSAIGAAKSYQAAKAQTNILNEGGMNQMKGEIRSMTAGLKGPEASAKNLASIQQDMPQGQIDNFKAQLGLGVKDSPVGQAKASLDVAHEELGQVKGNLAARGGEVDAKIADLKEVRTTYESEINRMQTAIDAKTAEVGKETDPAKKATLESDITTLGQVKDSFQAQVEAVDAKIQPLEQEKASLQRAVADKQTVVEEKTDAYAEQLEGKMKGLESDLRLKRTELNAEMTSDRPDAAKITALKKDVGALEEQVQWSRAYIANEEAQNGCTGRMTGALEKLDAQMVELQKGIVNQSDYQHAQAMAQVWNQVGTTISQLGSGLNTIGQQVSSNIQAAATEKQAEQKTAETAREESSALFDSAKELFSSVIQLLQAVLQAETQSIHQIVA